MRFALPFLCAVSALAANTGGPGVTFYKDVLPVLQNRCQECHRPGEIGPMSLQSYEQTRPWAKAIKTSVLSKKMPPWFADPHYGKFSNDRSLAPSEIETLVAWVDGGAKPGEPKDAPAPRRFVNGWNIPTPGKVIEMAEPFSIPAKGDVPYQYIVMPTGFSADKWISMAEARPSNRAVVHHIVVFIREPSSLWLRDAKPGLPFVPPGKDLTNTSGGGSEILMAYTPGMVPEIWEAGTAKLIKAGSDLVLQIHYTPNGTAGEDRTKIGLIFADAPPKLRATTLGVSNFLLRIPPGDPDCKVEARNTFPNGITLVSFFPHMHLRGKAFEYRAIYPGGQSEILLRVPKYDFNWQLSYKLAEPKVLPPGTRIEATAWYDNSPNNPRNPDPGAEVRFGEQSWEEMLVGFFDAIIPADMPRRDLFRRRQAD